MFGFARLDTDGDDKVAPVEARAQLSQAAIQQKLKFVICKISTGGNAASIHARWGWLKNVTEEHLEKLENADFAPESPH
jgi:hydroxyethylthiazole kinase